MSKLGSALTIYHDSHFKSAYDLFKRDYLSYLSDEEAKELQSLEETVKLKTEKMETAFKKLLKLRIANVCIESKRGGKSFSMNKSALAHFSTTGEFSKTNYLFDLTTDLANLQNCSVLLSDAGRYDTDWATKGLANLIGKAIPERHSYNNFIALDPDSYKLFSKYFDVKNTINLSNLIDEEKTRRKLARKAAAAGGAKIEAADAKVFTASINGKTEELSYNEVLALIGNLNKTPVLCVRTRSHIGEVDCYAEINVPKTAAEEKTFTLDDIRCVDVRSGALRIASRLKNDDYVFFTIKAGDYKRLKLWRDKNFKSEKETAIKILEDTCASVPKLTVLEYTDSLLEANYVDNAKEAIDKVATDDDKNTVFYARFSKACEIIKSQKAALASDQYKQFENYRRDFASYDVKTPIERRTVSPALFADYPMLQYFGARGRISVGSYYTDENDVRQLFDYVHLVESSKAD